MLIPIIRYQMNIMDIDNKWLEDWTKTIFKYLRKWWNIPNLNNNSIQIDNKNEGLNCINLKDMYYAFKIGDLARKLNSKRKRTSITTANALLNKIVENGLQSSEVNLIFPEERINSKDETFNNIVEYISQLKIQIIPQTKKTNLCVCWNNIPNADIAEITNCSICNKEFHSICIKLEDNLYICSNCKFEMFTEIYERIKEEKEFIDNTDIQGTIDWSIDIPTWEADLNWEHIHKLNRLIQLLNGNWYFKTTLPSHDSNIIDIFDSFKEKKCKHNKSSELLEIEKTTKNIIQATHILIITPFFLKMLTQWIDRWVYNFGRNSSNKTPIWWNTAYQIYQNIKQSKFKITFGKTHQNIEDLNHFKNSDFTNIFTLEKTIITLNGKIIQSKNLEKEISNLKTQSFKQKLFNMSQGEIQSLSEEEEITNSYWNNQSIPLFKRRIHYMARKKIWKTNKYMYTIKLNDNDKCTTCINEIENIWHILNKCPKFKLERMSKHDDICMQITKAIINAEKNEWISKTEILIDEMLYRAINHGNCKPDLTIIKNESWFEYCKLIYKIHPDDLRRNCINDYQRLKKQFEIRFPSKFNESEIYIIEISCPNDYLVEERYIEKFNKYKNISQGIPFKTNIIPIIIGTLGTINKKETIEGLKEMNLNEKEINKLLKNIIKIITEYSYIIYNKRWRQ